MVKIVVSLIWAIAFLIGIVLIGLFLLAAVYGSSGKLQNGCLDYQIGGFGRPVDIEIHTCG